MIHRIAILVIYITADGTDTFGTCHFIQCVVSGIEYLYLFFIKSILAFFAAFGIFFDARMSAKRLLLGISVAIIVLAAIIYHTPVYQGIFMEKIPLALFADLCIVRNIINILVHKYKIDGTFIRKIILRDFQNLIHMFDAYDLVDHIRFRIMVNLVLHLIAGFCIFKLLLFNPIGIDFSILVTFL